jgi:hypothetical protein
MSLFSLLKVACISINVINVPMYEHNVKKMIEIMTIHFRVIIQKLRRKASGK